MSAKAYLIENQLIDGRPVFPKGEAHSAEAYQAMAEEFPEEEVKKLDAPFICTTCQQELTAANVKIHKPRSGWKQRPNFRKHAPTCRWNSENQTGQSDGRRTPSSFSQGLRDAHAEQPEQVQPHGVQGQAQGAVNQGHGLRAETIEPICIDYLRVFKEPKRYSDVLKKQTLRLPHQRKIGTYSSGFREAAWLVEKGWEGAKFYPAIFYGVVRSFCRWSNGVSLGIQSEKSIEVFIPDDVRDVDPDLALNLRHEFVSKYGCLFIYGKIVRHHVGLFSIQLSSPNYLYFSKSYPWDLNQCKVILQPPRNHSFHEFIHSDVQRIRGEEEERHRIKEEERKQQELERHRHELERRQREAERNRIETEKIRKSTEEKSTKQDSKPEKKGFFQRARKILRRLGLLR